MNYLDPMGGNLNVRRYTDEEMNGWWDVTRVGEWFGSDSTGKAKKVEITQEKLVQMAEDYSPELHYAPVTTDHRDDGDALGYVEAVRVVGDKLQAKVSWADWGAFAVQGRAYVNRSAEMYDPMATTGRAYLAGFTFLGAGKPAAKGLSPMPSLLKDGQEITKITDDRMQLQEHAEADMDEKTLKEKIIGWFKAGEIVTPDNKEQETVELKEATDKIAALSEELTASKGEVTALKEQITAKDAEIASMKEATAKAERDTALGEITSKIKALGESGQMVPVEVEAETKFADSIPTDKLSEWWTERQKVYEARGLNLLGELTREPKGDPKPVRKELAETLALAKMAEKDEDRQHMQKCAELMAANDKMTFSEASKAVYASAAAQK